MENHNIQNSKQYDLEDRTLAFAREVRSFIKEIPRTIANIEDAKQLSRASGSVGANYIEANESLSKKDFVMRVKISRKESKESRFWLSLIDTANNSKLQDKCHGLIQEAKELMMIFSAIMRNSQ
ncbi:MAG: four helix bundle protein [Candidatus Omnitrophica bacterium]|nr:four helix bundle protein [Candidatus Omnitrophota bacterium]